MTLDDLVKELRSFPREKLLSDLAQYIDEWKSDDRDVNALETMIERFFGNVWIPSAEVHAKAYALWRSFKEEAVRGIGGMTMNERVFLFGLFPRYEVCKTEKEKLLVYSKLLAKP